MNSTNADCPINVPGLWHNGDCSLLCRPTKWYDILIFFLGNYLAHVATVVSLPGASIVSQLFNLVCALLFPFSGIGLGLEAIASLAIFAPTPLRTATRAGALLMVFRTQKAGKAAPECSSTQAINSEAAQNEVSKESADLEQNTISALPIHTYRPWRDAKIHGNVCLPEGYSLRRVPYYTKFKNDEEEVRSIRRAKNETSKWYDIFDKFSKRDKTTKDVTCSYSGAKAIVSIVQIIFGIYTLYRTRGNQVERFGYAAYGLTVTQYALMSIINLAGNLLRPDYTSMYIVGSNASDDLEKEHGCVIATVGRIEENSHQLERHKRRKKVVRWLHHSSLSLGIGIHLLVVGLMTKFTKGQSTLAQRVWIIFWLVSGALVEVAIIEIRRDRFDITLDMPNSTSLENKQPHEAVQTNQTNQPNQLKRYLNYLAWLSSVVIFSAYCAPAIGGFVVVMQMIRQYGVCSKMLDASV
jgi:hypothetical protein